MAEKGRDRKRRKLLLTLLIVGVVGGLAGFGTFSAFSSTTSNDNNSFQAGTVYITDNDGNAYMYQKTNAKPGDSVTSCINVKYLGSLNATVKLYASGTAGALAPYVNVKVEQGTGSTTFNDCTGFSATSTLYNGSLGGFPTTYGGGFSTNPGAGHWVTNDELSYRFTVTLADDNNANGQGSGPLSTGSHSFIWEARNA